MEGDVAFEYSADEVIFVADNNIGTLGSDIVGYPRGSSSVGTATSSASLKAFQEMFFKNGAVVGLVVETGRMLGKKAKERTEDYISSRYNPSNGAFKPLILDGDSKAKTVKSFTFSDFDHKTIEESLLHKAALALGIPTAVLQGGNNANIRPNVDLLYSFTVLPMVARLEAALEHKFNVDIRVDPYEIPMFRPDEAALWKRVESAVNNGVITGAEARDMLRLPELEDEEALNSIRVPQNIAGSATGVTGQEGGKPSSEEKE